MHIRTETTSSIHLRLSATMLSNGWYIVPAQFSSHFRVNNLSRRNTHAPDTLLGYLESNYWRNSFQKGLWDTTKGLPSLLFFFLPIPLTPVHIHTHEFCWKFSIFSAKRIMFSTISFTWAIKRNLIPVDSRLWNLSPFKVLFNPSCFELHQNMSRKVITTSV